MLYSLVKAFPISALARAFTPNPNKTKALIANYYLVLYNSAIIKVLKPIELLAFTSEIIEYYNAISYFNVEKVRLRELRKHIVTLVALD